jgi:hypothetical protein
LIPDAPAVFPPDAIHREEICIRCRFRLVRTQKPVAEEVPALPELLQARLRVPVCVMLNQQIWFDNVLRLFYHRRLAVFNVRLPSSQSSPFT